MDLRRQYAAIGAEIDAVVKTAMQNGAFILGPAVESFERSFAAFCGTKHCVGVASGTDALSNAIEALGIGPGDEVILPANTFIATAFAVWQAGARPILVDVDDSTMLISADAIASAITPRTRAIIPVHLFGSPVDMNPIMELARAHDLMVVEDACQAHGARYDGARVGSFGIASAFSFYPGKNLGAYGDGGAVVTDDEGVAQRVHLLRDLGQRKKYDHVIKGHNSRLDAIQAGILNVKLKYLDAWNEARRERARLYDKLLCEHGVAPAPISVGESVYHLYAIRLNARDKVIAALHRQGIETGIHYPVPIHLQPAFSEMGIATGSFPVSERWSDTTLSLPIFPELTSEEIHIIVNALVHAIAT